MSTRGNSGGVWAPARFGMEPKITLTPMSNTELVSLFNILGSKQSSFRFIAHPVSILVLSTLEGLNTFEEES